MTSMKFGDLDLCLVCSRRVPEEGTPVPIHVGVS